MIFFKCIECNKHLIKLVYAVKCFNCDIIYNFSSKLFGNLVRISYQSIKYNNIPINVNFENNQTYLIYRYEVIEYIPIVYNTRAYGKVSAGTIAAIQYKTNTVKISNEIIYPNKQYIKDFLDNLIFK